MPFPRSKGAKNAPWLGGVGWAGDRHSLAASRYPIDLAHERLLKFSLHSVAEAAWLLYHRSFWEAIDQSGFGKGIIPGVYGS